MGGIPLHVDLHWVGLKIGEQQHAPHLPQCSAHSASSVSSIDALQDADMMTRFRFVLSASIPHLYQPLLSTACYTALTRSAPCSMSEG